MSATRSAKTAVPQAADTAPAFIAGYSDPLSVQPGDEIAFMVSTSEPEYVLRIERLRAADRMNPDEVTRRTDTEALFAGTFPGRQQRGRMGSCITVPEMGRRLAYVTALTMTAWACPTLVPGDDVQVLMSTIDPDSGVGWELLIDPGGFLALCVTGDEGTVTATTAMPLSRRRWHAVHASYSSADGEIAVGYGCRETGSTTSASAAGRIGRLTAIADVLIIGASHRRPSTPASAVGRGHFNGRLEDIRLCRGMPRPPAGASEGDQDLCPDDVLAHWDFSHDIERTVVRDVSGHEQHGQLINMPTRAVRGHTWTGHVMDHRVRPQEYGAIHFHEDDVHDVGWTPDLRWSVPAGTPSGVYAAVLQAETGDDEIPFVVLPSTRRPTSDVVVILPTLTYQAYANSRVLLDQDPKTYGISADSLATQDTLALLAHHPEWGRSLYDVHRDGSGCVYASRRRPLLTMRSSYVNSVTNSPRNFSADLLLLQWLNGKNVTYDVITDEELDTYGVRALTPYHVALTGSHPEYCTEAMLDGLHEFIEAGGNLMYLGGNGYYWVTSFCPTHRDVIEVRRGNAGTRPWSSEPGEIHHATTGEPGGLWRDRGRPPNRLVGVGFSCHSWGHRAGHYTRLPASFNQRYSWIFDGVPENAPIGDDGLIMGGAAGDELDRYDADQTLPGRVGRIATSAKLPKHSYPAIEEILELVPDFDTQPMDLARADMVYIERANGGAVFSVGSLSWIGSLLSNNCSGHVSRITTNVLQRFRHVGAANDEVMMKASMRSPRLT